MPVDHKRYAANIERLALALDEQQHALRKKIVTAGFDGFTDTLVQVIRQKTDAPTLFTQIGEFGEYIAGKKGSSFSLETELINVKLGGNMPILSQALGKMGVAVNCVGAMGYPQVLPVFSSMSANCRLLSFADPGTTTALEFQDGKIMLANMGKLNELYWPSIRNSIGIDQLRTCYEQADLFCLVNWSEIDASTNIWKGVLHDVLPQLTPKKRISFFDLSDCSKRSKDSILEALELIAQFGQSSQTVLGLNRNEAGIIYECLYGEVSNAPLQELGQKIWDRYQPGLLLLHSVDETLAFNSSGVFTGESFYLAKPLFSTGAGDNFNAGFCMGLLMDLTPDDALLLANATAGYYIRNGESPDLDALLYFLKHYQD